MRIPRLLNDLIKALDLIERMQAMLANTERDASELWQALEKLAHECNPDGTRAPSVETYHHVQRLLQKKQTKYGNKKPQP